MRYRHRHAMGASWWHGQFRGQGYRVTMPRRAILEILGGTEKHLSAEEIYMAVHKIYPNIGLTTVYRTLELLAQMGLVFRFDFGDGRARYELSTGPKGERHHHHMVCTECGRVIDYTDFIDDEVELLNQMEKGLSKKFNFKITSHLIQFSGLCAKCQKKG